MHKPFLYSTILSAVCLMFKIYFFWASLCFYLFLCVCVFCHVYIQYFDLRHQQESVSFTPLWMCVVCVCVVFIASGIMPCSHVSGVTDPEEGIDDFRPPPPFSPLPVCLSPSLLHSFHGRSVRLAGRKACCFDAGSLDQIPLAECCVDPAENTTTSSSSLQKAPWLRELQLCVSVCVWFWSKLPGELTNSYTQPCSNRAEKLLDLQMLGWPARKS